MAAEECNNQRAITMPVATMLQRIALTALATSLAACGAGTDMAT